MKSWVAALVFIIAFPAQAKLFRNSYVSFELPNRWNCTLEGTEWICQSVNQKQKREAIIILTAKVVGAIDSLPLYQAHLKKNKTITGPKGKPFTSQIKSVKLNKILNHQWVDGLHLGSEIPSYYTRYLATVKKTIAILVTFSAHKRYYTKYNPDFLRAINSLRVVANSNSLSGNSGTNEIRPSSGGSLGGAISSAFPEDMLSAEELPDEPEGSSTDTQLLLLLGLALAMIGGYYIYSKKLG